MPTGTQGWIVVTVGKEQYLLRSYDTQDYSAAAWIKADTFLDQVLRLEHDTNRILALEDKEGVRITGEAYEGTKSMEVWRKEIGKYHLILVCTVEGNTIYEQIPHVAGGNSEYCAADDWASGMAVLVCQTGDLPADPGIDVYYRVYSER